MSIKMISLDLDGTLMLPDHITVSLMNKTALKEAHDRGIKIVISSGRTLSVINRVVEQIPFVDYVMYSDGAAVFDVKENKVIYEKLIDYGTVNKIISFLNTTEVYYNIYIDGKIATQNGRLRYYYNHGLPQEFIDDYMRNTVIYDDLLDAIKGKSVELIVGFFNTQEDCCRAREYIDTFSDSLYITSALKNEFEMTDKLATKGNTMRFLCQTEGIIKENVIAFGDSLNDLPMFEEAGISVAMENGDERIKEAADYVTASNADDGVAKAIEKFVLNN
jgi:Cof subfamily protein (haloacid dehalogenase superfamily)